MTGSVVWSLCDFQTGLWCRIGRRLLTSPPKRRFEWISALGIQARLSPSGGKIGSNSLKGFCGLVTSQESITCPHRDFFCSGSWVADRYILLLSCFWCLLTQISPNLYLLLERSCGLTGPGPAIPWFWRPDQSQLRLLSFRAAFTCADIFSSIIGVKKKKSGNRLTNIGSVAVLGSGSRWQLTETFSKTQVCITERLGCPPGANQGWQTSSFPIRWSLTKTTVVSIPRHTDLSLFCIKGHRNSPGCGASHYS